MTSREIREESVVVIAKTYPECSQKYGCLVCTAGVNEDGEWRRLYPIPWYLFRKPDWKGKFKKWDVIRVVVKKSHPDRRKESYYVTGAEEIEVVGSIDGWDERRKFAREHMSPDMEALWKGGNSLGIIKPNQLEDFVEKERERVTDEAEREVLEKTIQTLLPEFGPAQPSWLMPKEIPWIGYYYTCQGSSCKGHQMMCIDWEIQELYRKVGYEKTRQKALDWMSQRDLYFCVGTTWRAYRKAWMIISLIYPPLN